MVATMSLKADVQKQPSTPGATLLFFVSRSHRAMAVACALAATQAAGADAHSRLVLHSLFSCCSSAAAAPACCSCRPCRCCFRVGRLSNRRDRRLRCRQCVEVRRRVGRWVGRLVGFAVVGAADGIAVVGRRVGKRVGRLVGKRVGLKVGLKVGTRCCSAAPIRFESSTLEVHKVVVSVGGGARQVPWRLMPRRPRLVRRSR
jgi:hypothetical protein